MAAVVGVLDLVAVQRGWRAVERWAKPGTMVLLIAVALVLPGLTGPLRTWVLAALVLCTLGDVLLLGDSEARFLGGLGAFLLGHLAYVVAFVVAGLARPLYAVIGAVVLVGALVAGRRILPSAWRAGGAALGIPVAVYMATIGAMAMTGWATGRLLVGLGASLFVVSDTILALDRFVERLAWARVAVMATYFAAQFLLVAGLATALT